jgi:hypothetical protein
MDTAKVRRPCVHGADVHTLRRNIERAWEQLPQRHIQRAIAAMHDRMRTCVANGSEPVTKWYM